MELREAEELVEQLLEADGAMLEPIAQELYLKGCQGGGADAAAVAAVLERLLQDMPPEQGRVLRRAVLTTCSAQFEAAHSGSRMGICNLLCELFLVDCIPETVIHDCLEQLLGEIQEPELIDVECACAILQSVGPLLEASDLDAADEIMEDFFGRLQQLAHSGVLPFDQHQMVQALLRLRAAGWKEQNAPAAAPAMVLPPKSGANEAEDWRSVLDKKAGEGGSGNGGDGGMNDSARRSSSAAVELDAAAAGGAGAGAGAAGGSQQQTSEPTLEQQKQQAVQQLVAAAPAAAAWDVPLLVQQLQEQQAVLDLSAAADAEQLLAVLIDHAAASAAAAAASSAESAHMLEPLPLTIDGCAALIAELARERPVAAAAAASHLAATFKHRSEARGPAARQQLGHQMLLAGALAQRGVLPEQQLQGLLEQLARQVMKPTPSDVVCLRSLLRGAGKMSEGKKAPWWKAAAQLASSDNVSGDQQRDLQHLLLLREHKWDAAAAARAVHQEEARKKAEAAAAALEEATRQRQVQEEAAAKAAAEVKKAEEQAKAAAAMLAQLHKQQAAAEAAAAEAKLARQEAEAAAEAAAKRRSENDKAMAASKRQAQEAQAEVIRAKQQAEAVLASAAAASASMAASGGGSGSGDGSTTKRGRHWYYATSAAPNGAHGPFTAAELVAWQYQDVMLAGELQVIRAHTTQWQRLEDKLQEILAELPRMPHLEGAPPVVPAGGRGGRGRRGGRFPLPGRGGHAARGMQQQQQQPQFAAEYAPASAAQQQQGPVAPFGRGAGRGRGRAEQGRGGRGRGREQAFYGQLQQEQQQYQAPQRAASPPRFGLESMPPRVIVDDLPSQPTPAAAGRTAGGYDPLHQPRHQVQPQQAAAQQQQPTGLCPSCLIRESCNRWVPCGHLGHCSQCMPDYLSNEEKLANCDHCLACGQKATHYIRIYN